MSKHDEIMASIIGRSILQPDVRKQILNDPASALASKNLPSEYQEKLIEGLREIDAGGLSSEKLPKKFGTNAWGVGGSVL